MIVGLRAVVVALVVSVSGAVLAQETSALRTLTGEARVARLFIDFQTLVVRDGLDPQAVHRAFLAIDEYRFRIAPDTEGAEFEDPPEED